MAETADSQKLWTPSNIITITRIILVPVFVTALLAPWPEWFGLDQTFSDDWKRIVAAAVFVIISGTDWLDGYLARSRNEVTDFGKFMDPLADKILVAAALISLVELDALPSWVVLIILAREFIVSGIRMMAASKGVVIAASMLGKFKTVFQMIAIVLFVIKDSYVERTIQEALGDPLWDISWLVMLAALALTIASLIDYLVKARPLFGLGNPKAGATGSDLASTVSEEEALRATATSVVTNAQAAGVTVATAESLTGGMIGEYLTSVPGSSAVFMGGIISYTEAVKMQALGVPAAIIRDCGVVSGECAAAMAQGARRAMGSDIAVAVTGIAGPGGAEPGKPVGTVWLAIAAERREEAVLCNFQGDRDDVRRQTVARALQMILREISGEVACH